MKFKGLTMPKGITSLIVKTKSLSHQNGPTVMVVGGVIGVVASTVLACRATLKAETVVHAANKEIETIRETAPAETKKKELTKAYVKVGLDVALLYLPAVGLGALSITSILASHKMLTKRNAALAAAYTTLDQSFKDYRARVADRYGEEIENDIYYNLQEYEIEETVTDKNGKEKKVKKKVKAANSEASPYARFFMPWDSKDPHVGSISYERAPGYNEITISHQEFILNDLLRGNGYVFLNDVYAALGFSKTVAGQAVGWVYDPKDPIGDNHIKFITRKVWKKDSYGEMVETYLIDFNVDGPIVEAAKSRNLIRD